MDSIARDWAAEAWREYPLREGHFKMRRPAEYAGEHWTRRPWMPVRIWFSAPADPVSGLPLDRAPRWQALLGGEPVELNVVWPWCSRHEITEAEYDALMEARER